MAIVKNNGTVKTGAVITGNPIPDPKVPNPAPTTKPVGKKPSKPKKKQTIVYLPDNISIALDRYCNDSGMTKSSVMCKALYDYLRQYQNDVII